LETMGSIIHTKGITSKNGLISSEIGRGGSGLFLHPIFSFVFESYNPIQMVLK
jgi:hypothetical protein